MNDFPTIDAERAALDEAKQVYAELKVKIQAAKDVVSYYEHDAMQRAMLEKSEKELSNPDKRKAAMLEFFEQNENAVTARQTLAQLEIEKIMVAHAVDVAEDRVKDVQAQRMAWEIERKKEIVELEYSTATRFESAYTQLNQAMQARLQSSKLSNGGK